jgi:hypothetical protein
VKSPQLLDRVLWEKTGHWDNYRQNMFIAESENRMLAVKPMNCPGHVLIYKQGLKSYRDLPLRIAEFGSCHRNEPSGALHGLMRVRAFTQDDAHIFCTEEQVNAETVAFCDLLRSVYADFGFTEVRVKFSDRPPQRAGSDEVWDKAEHALQSAPARRGARVHAEPGGGRLLRTEARVRAPGRDRSRLAVRHAAGRLPVLPERSGRVRRRGRHAAAAGDAAPGDPRLVRAVHRHPDRELRRALPDLARADPGRGAEYHRPDCRVRVRRRLNS